MGSSTTRRKWVRERLGKYSAKFILGERAPLTGGEIVSITYGERMKIWQLVLNGLYNQLIMRALTRNTGLVYGELSGNFDDFKNNWNLTLSVWKAREMVEFRDKGLHGFARRFLGWVLWGHADGAYFLTYKPMDGRIPTTEEAIALVKAHGSHVVRGTVVRKASKPDSARPTAA